MSHVAQGRRRRVRAQAGDRCGYCLSAQKYLLGMLEIENFLAVQVRREWVAAGWHPPQS
jgi:hypothetical protein